LRWHSFNSLPGWALNHNPPDISLLTGMSHEHPAPELITLLGLWVLGWTSSPALCCDTSSSLSWIPSHTLWLSLCFTIQAVKNIYIKSFAPYKMLIMKRGLKAVIRTTRWFSVSIEEVKFQRFEVTSRGNRHHNV
jgi:hypothetical protein